MKTFNTWTPSLVALALLLASCDSDSSSAVDAGRSNDAGRTPAPATALVSAEQLADVLATSEDGEPILAEIDGTQLTIGAPRKDAIGAAAKCTDLVTACVLETRDLDGCVERLPVCESEVPWDEAQSCCALACKEAYLDERELGATVLEAHDAVFGSTHECFPGLQDKYRAAGGTPYLAPRRAK